MWRQGAIRKSEKSQNEAFHAFRVVNVFAFLKEVRNAGRYEEESPALVPQGIAFAGFSA